ERQQALATRILVLPLAELRGHVLPAAAPHRHGAMVEVARDGVALPFALEVELHAVRAAVPRAPALEGRQRPVAAPIAVQPVERGRDRGQERGLAALVVVEDHGHSVGIERDLPAQRAEAVGLEPEELHDSRSSWIGITSLSWKASRP